MATQTKNVLFWSCTENRNCTEIRRIKGNQKLTNAPTFLEVFLSFTYLQHTLLSLKHQNIHVSNLSGEFLSIAKKVRADPDLLFFDRMDRKNCNYTTQKTMVEMLNDTPIFLQLIWNQLGVDHEIFYPSFETQREFCPELCACSTNRIFQCTKLLVLEWRYSTLSGCAH